MQESSTPVRASLSFSRPNTSLNLSSVHRRTASSLKYTDYPKDDKGTSMAEMAYNDEVWSKYSVTQSKHYWEGKEAHDARPDSFGKTYVKKVYDLIQYYFEASINLWVCYVGDQNNCLADDLERELRLVQTIEQRRFDSTSATDADNGFSAIESNIKNAAERALHFRENDHGAGAVYDRVLVKNMIKNVRDMQRIKPLKIPHVPDQRVRKARPCIATLPQQHTSILWRCSAKTTKRRRQFFACHRLCAAIGFRCKLEGNSSFVGFAFRTCVLDKLIIRSAGVGPNVYELSAVNPHAVQAVPAAATLAACNWCQRGRPSVGGRLFQVVGV